MHQPISVIAVADIDLEAEYYRQQEQRRHSLSSTHPDPVPPAPSQRISRIPNEFSGHGYTYAANPIPHEGATSFRARRILADLQGANNPPPARGTRSQTNPAHDVKRG